MTHPHIDGVCARCGGAGTVPEVQALLRKLWLEGGGNPDIAEPTEQEVADLMHGLTVLVDEYEREEAERIAGVQENGNG
jgi:hypothetical protein